MRDALREKKCGTCNAFQQDNPAGPGLCVRNPPTILPVGIAPRGSVLDLKGKASNLGLQVQSFYPPVTAQHGCHQWVPNKEVEDGAPVPPGPTSPIPRKDN